MKYALLSLLTSSILFSCTDPININKVSESHFNVHDMYLNQAEEYMEARAIHDQSRHSLPIKLDSTSNIRIETILMLTRKELETSRITAYELDRMVRLNYSHTVFKGNVGAGRASVSKEDRAIINEINALRDSMAVWTMSEDDKLEFNKFNDSLKRWKANVGNLDSNKRIGYSVRYLMDFHLSNGETSRNRPYILHFDKKHNLKNDWNVPINN